MKWLRRILIVIVVLPILGLGFLFLAGTREGAGRNQTQIEIAAPRSAVFQFLEQPELIQSWSGATEVRPLSPGGLQAGSRSRLVLQVEGRKIELEAEATAVERDQHIALALKTVPGSSTPFSQLVHYRLSDVAGGTRLAVTVDTLYEGGLMRLLEPAITPAAQRQLVRNMARLKRQVEDASK
jgi:uncharacterized protein YndB with AHSA1/START domain